MKNYMKLDLLSRSENESFARSAVAAFCLPLNPTLNDLSDIRTAVSEAVTNCIVHAYKGREGLITIECEIDGEEIHISVIDDGVGIEDIEKAVQPFFTTLSGDERSGMGFTIMQSFMSDFSVKSERGKGTVVSMSKSLRQKVGEDVRR